MADGTALSSVMETEKGLIDRILAGEVNLFHELIRPYERMVYLTVYGIVKNESDAEDGAQEAIINAFRSLRSFRGDAKFSTWLVTIAMNEGRKRLRRAKNMPTDSLDEDKEDHDGDFTPLALTDWREIPSAALEKKELREIIRRAVDELPTIYREVLMLRDLDELNQEETAAALGITVTLVKVRLHRARMLLQKKLVPYLKTVAPAKKKGLLGRLLG